MTSITEILTSQQIHEATLTSRDILDAADPDDLDTIARHGNYVRHGVTPPPEQQREFIEVFYRCIPNTTGYVLGSMSQSQITTFENIVARFIFRHREVMK